jgi:hypothetical protein
LNPALRYNVHDDVTFQKLDDETVVVHLGTGKIHHTNPAGSRVWELLQEGRSLGEMMETLQAEFEASPLDMERDVAEFLEVLERENVVEIAGPGA